MDEFIVIKQKLEISVDGVLLQIQRIKDEYRLSNEAVDFDEKWKYNVQRINDENSLKNLLKISIDWLKELNNYIEEFEEIFEELSNNKSIKDLRDMFEHEIEYLQGNGHQQKRFIDKNTLLTASETGITEMDYLIGGRLKLSYVEKKFNEIKSILKNNNFTFTITGIMKL